MSKFKYLYDPQSALGGHEYYATTDGETVHIKHKAPNSNSFRIVQRLSKASWDRFVEDKGLDDPYRCNNPVPISRLASATAYNDSPYYSEYITA